MSPSSGGSGSYGGSSGSGSVVPPTPPADASSPSNPSVENQANATAFNASSLSTQNPAEPKIEFLIPDSVKTGELVSIVVFSDSAPAVGVLRISSPSGLEYPRLLSNGRVEFVFAEPGDWEVGFGNSSKKLEVVDAGITSIPIAGKISNSGFFHPQLFDYAWLLAAAFLLPIPE